MRNSSLSSRDVLKHIGDYICDEGLSVGDRLPSIRQFSERFDVGRNVVRDALLQAVNLGLVRMHPRAGTFVDSLNYRTMAQSVADLVRPSMVQVDHHLFDLLDVRRMIEVEAVGGAADRRRLEDLLPVREALGSMDVWQKTDDHSCRQAVKADVQFHLQIVKITGNPLLLSLLKSILVALQPHMLAVLKSPDQRKQVDGIHWEIYRALVEGDAVAARDAMLRHFTSVYEVLLKTVRAPAAKSAAHSDRDTPFQTPINGGEVP